jgi:hypothetical protein
VNFDTIMHGEQILNLGSDLYKPTSICVCVRFSSTCHTGLVEGQKSSAKQKLPATKKKYNEHVRKCVWGSELDAWFLGKSMIKN